MQAENPLIIQKDMTILVETAQPQYAELKFTLSRFAELIKCPDGIHTYKISAISLWNSFFAGFPCSEIIDFLRDNSRYDIPDKVTNFITQSLDRVGKVKLVRRKGQICLFVADLEVRGKLLNHPRLKELIPGSNEQPHWPLNPAMRGEIKSVLAKLGYPVDDELGFEQGDFLDISFNDSGLTLRDYQLSSADAFYKDGDHLSGNGVIVLPCGAGKTVVGLELIERLKTCTLILTTNNTSVRQWKEELLRWTSLKPDMIGEFSSQQRDIKPITITTYQMVSYRRQKAGCFPNFQIFDSCNWGFIVYDEVHLLPAPIFRVTSQIQARRRLGLTATLIREDRREEEVFSLIGPKRYEASWRELERQGWIATATCTEVRVRFPERLFKRYSVAEKKDQMKIAASNSRKIKVLDRLIKKHKGARMLIIGHYLDQLYEIAERYGADIMTGKTPAKRREQLYSNFKQGKISMLILSRVANFAVDLPDANVAIQVSGLFGSRQEEAQRLGRILRAKKPDNTAYFYSLITADSCEVRFAHHRQLFLTEQGYNYSIVYDDKL